MTLPHILFVVTEDWYAWLHRRPMARAARDAGFRVTLATRLDPHERPHRARLASEGFAIEPLGWRRGSADPAGQWAAVAELSELYRRLRPDIVHHVSMKPIALGTLAARRAGITHVVNAFTGLGFLFTSPAPRARWLRHLVIAGLRAAAPPGTRYLVENPDDAQRLAALGLAAPQRIGRVHGSGVDLARYRPLPLPAQDGTLRIGCAARLLRIKGIEELVEGVCRARAAGAAVELRLAGAPDVENPASFTETQLRQLTSQPGITWLGPLHDVRQLWADVHLGALVPRGGEGIPVTLMEAAGCGRGLIATDVPGCREIAVDGRNGVLVPPHDPAALAETLIRLAADPDEVARMGAASPQVVAASMSAEAVGADMVRLYRAMLAGTA